MENTRRTAVYSTILPVLLYVVGTLVFFRGQIFSKFDLVFGDRRDARLVAFIHEHIYQSLYVHSGFLSPPDFFNQTKTLGYTNVSLLDQIIYAPLRLLGVEPLLALSLVAIILSPIAYVFTYLFLRRFDVSIALASLSALIFTFANNLFLKSVHLEHLAVYYIPIVIYCGLLAVSEVHRRPRFACILGAFSAALYGLLFSTAYYMAWFFGLALLIYIPIALLLAWPQALAWWRKRPARVIILGLMASLGFIAALSIFAIIYVPVLDMGAKRDFSAYLFDAPQANDIINVGGANLVWGKLIRVIGFINEDRLENSELTLALTPIVQILLLSSAIIAFRPRLWPANDLGRLSRAFVIASACVCVLFYLLTIKIGNFSMFHVLYKIVPGANAIRDGYRAMIIANLFAVTALALALNRVRHFSSPKHGTLLSIASVALLALAAIEQINLVPRANLSRKFERERTGALSIPPRECRTFYVAPQNNRSSNEVQIDAMMVALDKHLPTINGYSGFDPPGWDLSTTAPDYEQRVTRWALKRGVAQGLCRLDVESRSWIVIPSGGLIGKQVRYGNK